jgi:L-fucose isomerase-like protein
MTPVDSPMSSAVVIPTARPTFAVEVAQERADAARALLASLGADVTGPERLVMTPDDVEAAAPYLDGDGQLVVNVCASFSDATPALRLYGGLRRPVLLWSFREPGPIGDRLWLNSLCGANLFAHALVREGGAARLVYGDPDEPAVREALSRALRGELPAAPELPTQQRERAPEGDVRPALDALRGRRIGLVGDPPPGFTPCEYDAELIERLFGISVERIELAELFSLVDQVAEPVRAAERDDACAAQPSLRELDPRHVERSAAVTSALRDWSAAEQVSALAVRCWPEFPTELGVCPCSSLSRLADAGTPTACERDVYGVLTMLLAEALGAGTTYIVDTVDLDVEANVVRLWHCGAAATTLAADPAHATQYVHCNRRIGVAGNFSLKTGRVVMARLTENPADPGGLRLLIASGESVPEPNRFQGNTAAVRLDADAQTFVHGLVHGGFPHHTVLAWTDVRRELRAAADILGIPVVEW